MIRGLLFDLDGTLVRTNEGAVDTWLQAFRSAGFSVGRERVEREIGRGGDLLVSEVLGVDVEAARGDALRAAKAAAYATWLAEHPVELERSALELLRDARAAGLRVALATSSSEEDLGRLEARLGLRFADVVDEVATFSEGDTSKPAPDVVEKACAALGLDPLHCALVGDSLHDALAARRAGVAFVGTTTGYVSAPALRCAGARVVVGDLEALRAELDGHLGRCDRTRMDFDAQSLNAMLDTALAAAAAGMAEGEAPIGAALFDAAGNHVVSGHNRSRATGERTMHAEMNAFRKAPRLGKTLDPGTIMVSTLEPCVMCLGAAMEVGVDVVIYGLAAPSDGGLERVAPPTSPENLMCRVRGGIRAREARDLFVEWRRTVATPEQTPYVDELLERTNADGTARAK